MLFPRIVAVSGRAVSLVGNRAIKTIRTTFPITLILMEKSCCASSGSGFRLEGNSQTKVRLKLDANRKIIFEMWFNHKTIEIKLQNNRYNAHNFKITTLWLHFMLSRKHLIFKQSSINSFLAHFLSLITKNLTVLELDNKTTCSLLF